MRVNFFRFEGQERDVVLLVLAKLKGLPDDKSRTKDIAGTPFRMQELHRSGRFWDGDIVRIRMDDLPVIVSLAGEVDEFDVEDDEGVGEETAFRFDSTTAVLAIQSNRSGASPSKLARFLEAIGKLDAGALTPVAVPQLEPLVAIGKLEEIRKVRIRYAGLKNATLLADTPHSSKKKLELAAATAPAIEVGYSMSHERGSLDLKPMKELLRSAVAYAKGDGGIVERIEVVGTFDDDSRADMNLLQFFMKEQVEVSIDPESRRMLYADRRAGVSNAFQAQRAELEKRYA